MSKPRFILQEDGTSVMVAEDGSITFLPEQEDMKNNYEN